jgi:hypothetical protein
MKTGLSTPKQKLLDAKNQAALYEQEERAAEVFHIARNMSEVFIASTVVSVLDNFPSKSKSSIRKSDIESAEKDSRN